MSTTTLSRERELAVRFLALPKERRQRFYSGLVAQGIGLNVLPIPPAAAGGEREQLSYAQERLWFLAQLDPDSTAYNMAGALRLRGAPDEAALSRALSAIVQRHEVLRTRFETHAGVARTRVVAAPSAPLLQSDARAEYARDGEAAVLAWAEREAETVFDLAEGPLLRVHLVRFGEADYGLYVCMHHIVSDGWSLRVFIGEFARCYEHFAMGGAGLPTLPELTIQYADYATWQRAWLEAGERERQLGYWRQQLAGVKNVLRLPIDHARPEAQSQRGAVLQLVLPAEQGRALRKVAQAQGVTLFMLGLAAFKAVLHRATDETDLCVGSNVANRSRIETEVLIGFFVNTQVLRTRLSPEMTFLQLLAAVKQVALAAQTHQELPFEQLVDALSPERSLAHNPLFQVHYDHQGSAYDAVRSLAGLSVGPITREQRSTVFDLMLTTLEQADGSIAATFGYATDLFERATIERFAARFTRVLTQVVRAPDTRLMHLELGDPGEQSASADSSGARREMGRLFCDLQKSPVFTDEATRAWIEARRSEHVSQRLYVLDAEQQPVAAGLVGDLYWGGVAAADAELDPWAEHPGERMLDAGQRARFRGDGALEVLLQPTAAASPASAEPREHIAAANDFERKLSRIFCEVLQLAAVSVQDNFFELGGDSIIAIQVVSRAREQGMALRPKDLFQYQTVQRLAAAAKPLTPTASAAAAGGESRLTPIQQAFFTRALPEPDHFNQSVLLASDRPLDTRALERALQCVVARHEVLRSGFKRSGERVVQCVEPLGAVAAKRMLVTAHVVDAAEASARCEDAQRSLELSRADVMRALQLCAADGRQWLLLVVHHLVIDGVSWRILLDDLQRAYAAIVAGEEPPLPLSTTAFGVWAERLHEYAQSTELAAELAYWQRQVARIVPLPAELPAPLRTLTMADVQRVPVRLDRADTERLLKESGAAYRTHVQELLLAALSRAVCETFAQSEVAISLEGHGREDLFDGLDVSRTLGWFTTEYPVVLTPERELSATIKRVKEQLRSVPQRGLGYGVLRELALQPQLRAAERPSIGFNYLGQFDTSFSEAGLFRVADEPAGPEAALSTPLAHALEINGQIYAGELSLWLNFSPRMFTPEKIARLAASFERELRVIIAHCASARAGGVTPSDFPLAALEQSQLDALVSEHGVPEDVYPVTPMQHGMLFHALYEAEPGIYVTQLAVTIDGLDEARFVEAWRRALSRHAILRTQFVWSDREQPLQLVVKHAELAFDSYDLRDLADQSERLDALTREQHRRGFELQRAPLWRVSLARLDERRYAFVWTHHHLLLDGWSTARLLDEVLLDYLGRAQPRAAYAFSDYVAWLSRREQGASEQFWRERLRALDEPSLLVGQLAGPARPQASSCVQVERTRLSAAETQALNALAQRQHVTLNALVQAAWALLLQRYTAQSAVVFGATTSGRPHDLPGSEQMLGLFINTLPVIVELQPTAALAQLWQSVQEAGLAAREHEYTPLAKLLRWAGVVPGQSELFDTLIVFENFPIDSALQGAWQELSFGAVQTVEITNYALTIAVHPGAELELDYAFDPGTLAKNAVQRVAAQMLALLRAFPQLPAELPLGQLALSGEPAKQVSYGPIPTFIPMHVALMQRMRARKQQAQALVVGGGEAWTFALLERRVHVLTQCLRERGVGPDVRVGLYVQRGPWLVAGALAVWHAGGAYVPLDPAYPRERLEWMAADAQLRLVLCSDGYAALSGVESVSITAAASGPEVKLAAAAPVHPQQLAYVIYTSGSTGTPKGVGVSHAALAMHAHAIAAQYEMTEDDCALQMASASFDASVEQWTTPLLSGARLVLSDEQPWTGSETLEVLRRERVSVIYPPTSQLVALCQHLEESGEAYELRICCVGGEAVSRENIALIRRSVQPQLIINGYGPTETVITPLAWRATADTVCQTAYAPIGWVIGDRSAHVLDGELNIQPRGVAGELYLGGSGVARGYLGRAALTAERFVPDPFGSAPGTRLYRTGDRVRALEDGTIEFLGRIDHQVKLRGYRIELGEIEARLLADGPVIEAVVVVRNDSGNAQLVGYVSSHAEPLQLEVALTQRLRAELPAHMVPSRIVVLPQLPHTPNGKIDRRALPAPELPTREHIPARTPLERELLTCFADVLRRPEVGVNDDFFELGGDSLVSLQLVSRLRARGHALSLREIFALRTVASLAAALAEQTEPVAIAPAVERVARKAWHPLSYAQERLWFLAQLEPDSAAYNISAGLRMRGTLDLAALRCAFAALVSRHEVLRTRFEELDGQGVQRIEPMADVPLQLIDARGLEAEARARALFAEELARPFALDRAPLLRVLIVQLADDEHVLMVSVHHIVADGWSMRLLIEELARAYAGASLPEPALQYVDFSAWQRQWLSQGELARQLEYWRKQLGDEHPALDLPLDRPRHAFMTRAGGSVDFAVPAAVSDGIAQLAQRSGASTFMLLLAALQCVLYRVTGQRDVRVGVPMSNRNRLETESVVGLFVNTLVLRTELDGSLSFEGVLARVKESALGAQSHQDLPFEHLVEALAPERSLRHNPLFQVMFDHQRAALAPLRTLPGLSVEPFSVGERSVQFDLTLDTIEEQGSISGSFSYASELFDRATIEALCQRFQAVLRAVVEAPQLRVSELPLLARDEQRLLLAAAGPRRTGPLLSHDFVHLTIDAQARLRPDACALQGENAAERWSYARLERVSNQWAHELLARGVVPESRVGLCMGRAPSMVAAALAIFKAGGAYVPLDPSYPRDRLQAMVDDAAVKLIVSDGLQPLAAELGVDVCRLQLPRAGLQHIERPQPRLSPDNLAYVIYTSGSTGRPKGVGVTHAALACHVAAIGSDYGMSPEDCALHFASMSFDAGVEQWVSPLCHGAQLFIRGDELWSAERAVEVLRERGVSWFEMPPRYLTEVARAALARGETLKLRACTAGGEAVPRESLSVVLQAIEPAPLVNGYGPTEAVITPMTWHSTHATQCQTAYAPIGRAVGPRRAYVLDAELNLVPRGVTGELYLAGAANARGYLGRPDLTAERFVPDPFVSNAGAIMYRTGDLARLRADGEVEYIGRADHQVKLRGFRIELGEIEAQLLAHPGVREAVVVAEGGAVASRLLGYVAGELDVDALRAQLRAALPEYMVPAQLIVLPTLPRNENGKLDRKRLPAVQAEAQAFEAPESQLEAQLCAIVSEVLELSQVGRTHEFFALGGDSLRSLQVVSRARKLGLSLKPRDLFETRTIAELAQRVQPVQLEAAVLTVLPRTAALYPLSYAQERMWFLAQLEPESSAYNITSALRIQGELDSSALEAALGALVQRHETLRTTFELQDGAPHQRVHMHSDLQLHKLDVSELPLETAEARARVLVEEHAHTPFDLARGPLLRAALTRLPGQAHVLSVVVHHIVADGWSMDVFVADLIDLYHAAVGGRVLPALPVQYIDYAAWQRRWLEGPERARQLAYWTAELGEEHPVLSLPVDHARRNTEAFQGAVLEHELDAELGKALHALARAQGVSMFMLLLAAWQTLLYRLTGQSDIRVGVPISNRSRVETERLIGLFVNTQVLRSHVTGELRFGNLLQEVKRSALGASAHRDLPFEQLVEALQPQRSLGQNPLFQVTFNHASAAASVRARQPVGLQLSEFGWQARATQFDLSLDSEELAGQRLRLAFTYASDLFDARSVQKLAARLHQLLGQIAADPTLRIAELAILDAPEHTSLMAAAGPRVPGPMPESLFVHACVTLQAERRPDAIALEDERGVRYSYAQLERASNQWAQRLRQYGVGPEVKVGLCLRRSCEMVVATLAISKAGGAYVSLDPSYPSERLRAIAEDAGLALVITERQQLVAAQLGVALLVCLDAEDVNGEPAAAPGVRLSPENLAYVVYTSGSTGKPKGVGVSHAALARHLSAIGADYRMTEADCALHFASLSFDAGIEQWASPLMYGARVFVRGDELWSGEQALELFRERGVSWFDVPPGYARELAHAALERDETLQLRACSASAEALSRETLGLVLEAISPAPVVNGYGPTEAVITPMTWHVRELRECTTAYAPIGRVVGPRRAYVLDADLNLVPAGVTGELYLGGLSLARGYLDQAGRTAERFIPDPYAAEPGARMYRTGDLARAALDGEVEYLGRADHQVKLRGFRVELGEIEAQLLAAAGVRDAVVIAQGGAVAQRLVAYVVGDVRVEALETQLRAALPEYMVPSQWLVLPQLPRNVNGKVDRKQLPEPTLAPEHYVEPVTPIERKLAEIWAEVLQIERVGRTDNFFLLGGHSLLVMRVIARVRAELGCELAVRELFETRDLSELAALIQRAQANPSALAAAVAGSLSELENLSEEELAKLLNEEE
ncbi:MAG TPA: amino acid adenylation domain-containing protein [Polyangiales bacterium]|nr:amino acid adenylation domain-containing protein [Polyangiales bacterium]